MSVRCKDTVEKDSQAQANSFLDYMSKKASTYFSDSLLPGLQVDELYNHFELSLTGFKVRLCPYFILLFPCSTSTPTTEKYIYARLQVKVPMAGRHDIASTLVKMDASIVFGLCIFLDEPLLKQLEVIVFG